MEISECEEGSYKKNQRRKKYGGGSDISEIRVMPDEAVGRRD